MTDRDKIMDRLLHRDLLELEGTETVPDLYFATLDRLERPAARPAARPAPRRTQRWPRYASVAVVLLVIGLISVIALAPLTAPQLDPADGSEVAVRDGEHVLETGAVLLTPGSPPLQVAGKRITDVDGRVVVLTGSPDTPEGTAARLKGLPLTEAEMSIAKDTKRWLIHAGFALLVLSGNLVIEDIPVDAQQRGHESLTYLEERTGKFSEAYVPMFGQSAIATEERHFIDNERDWKALWERHRPGMDVPPVDFKTERVLALFEAATPGVEQHNRYHLIGQRLGKHHVLQIALTRTHPPGILPKRRGNRTCRFLFFTPPAHPVELEERRGSGETASWERTHTFAEHLPENESAMEPLRTITGLKSGIERAEFRYIQTRNELAEVWRRHRPDADLPEVDFEREVVAAAFFGRTFNPTGVTVDNLHVAGDLLYVRLTNGTNPRHAAMWTRHPYVLLVLPKDGGPAGGFRDVVFEQRDRFIMRGGEPRQRLESDPVEYVTCRDSGAAMFGEALGPKAVFALEVSSGMTRAELDDAVRGVIAAIEQMDDTMEFDCVVFSGDFDEDHNHSRFMWGALLPATRGNKAAATGWLNSLRVRPDAKSALYPALRRICQAYPSDLDSLVLLARSAPEVGGDKDALLKDFSSWFERFEECHLVAVQLGGDEQDLFTQLAALSGGGGAYIKR